MIFEFQPKGVCSMYYKFDIENNIIQSLEVTGGCQGNLRGISKLLVGMDVDEVIKRLDGIDCHFKGTSCPDQIAKALKTFKEKQQ